MAGIAIVAEDMFDLLYGDKFDNSVILVQIIAFHIPVVAIDMILGMILFASDQQRKWVLVGCTAAVLNPILNLFAIPFTRDHYDNGAIGAAVTTIATEMVMMFGGFHLRPPGVLDRWTAGYMLAALVQVPMVVVMLVLGDFPCPSRSSSASWCSRHRRSCSAPPRAATSASSRTRCSSRSEPRPHESHHTGVNEMSTSNPAQNAVHVSAVSARQPPRQDRSGGRQRAGERLPQLRAHGDRPEHDRCDRVAIRELLDTDARLHYVHSDEPGLSRAFNDGIGRTTGEIIAFTDDDCVVPSDWMSTIAAAFESEPDGDLLYGQVVPLHLDAESRPRRHRCRSPHRRG